MHVLHFTLLTHSTYHYFKSSHGEEIKLCTKHHKVKEASLLRNIRRVNKDVVNLGSSLDDTTKALDLMECQHRYNVNVAVKDAKNIERSHFSDVAKTQREVGSKLRSAHIVSALFNLSQCINTFTNCLDNFVYVAFY